jgi:hypothetical protein
MNASYVKICHEPTKGTFASTPIHTTLYDLIGAIDAAVGSDTHDIVTDVASHVLKTYRVSCLGDYEGYRMVLDEEQTSYSAVA